MRPWCLELGALYSLLLLLLLLPPPPSPLPPPTSSSSSSSSFFGAPLANHATRLHKRAALEVVRPAAHFLRELTA